MSVNVDNIRIHVPEMEIHQAGAAPDDAGNDVYVSERRIRLAEGEFDLRKREADVPEVKEGQEYGIYDQLPIFLISLDKVKRACFSGSPLKTRRAILQIPMASL